MVNAQEYIKQKLFDHKIKILDLEGQELEGHLDLCEFTELEELNCSRNELISLEVDKCKNLKKINCSYNLFDNLDFLAQLPNPEKLTYLNMEENGTFISLEEKIKMLMPFVNLEKTEEEVAIESLMIQLEENKEQLKKEVGDLKEQNFQLEEENNTLKVNQQQLEKKLLELQNHQLISLQKQNTQLLNKIAEQEEELIKYQNILQTNQSSLQELENKKNGLEAKLREKEKETGILQKKIDKLRIEISEVQESYQQMLVKFDSKKNDNLLNKELQEAKKSIERLEKELAKAEEDLENNQEQVLNLRKELLDKNKEVKKAQAEKQIELDSLQTEKDKLQLEFNALKNKLESNKKELKHKKQELSETKQSLEKEKLSKSIGLTRELRRQKEKLEKEVEKLKTRNKKLEIKLAEKNQQIITIDDKIKSNVFPVKPNLKKLLGKGGYGEVHYGEWNSQEVAVKKLHLSDTPASDLKEIQKEVDILKSLRNRYIIQYYDTYSENQELLIIMDYAENGTLTRFINDNKDKEHDWDFNKKLINQIVLGLTYIHSRNIVHRDLKSMNILLAYGYQVKISDFGLSKVKNIGVSQSKDVKGTLKWMAPEVLQKKKFSEQSDIYALGMIIWEIVAKCTDPFKDVDNSLVGFHIINGGKETIPSNTPKNIREIIQQCWKDNPDERATLEKIIEIICLIQPVNEKKLLDDKNSKTQVLGVNEKNYSSSILELSIPDDLNAQEENNQELIWTNIHSDFSEELVSQWQNLNFNYSQTQDWINAGLQPAAYNFCTWLRDEIKLTPAELLNDSSRIEDLREQFLEHQQTYVEQPPK